MTDGPTLGALERYMADGDADDPPRDRPRMPPEIAKAQIEAMLKIEKISKDARNEQGRYNYATVDQVYDDLRPILAEVGINPISFPVSSKIVARPGRQGDNNWLDCEFDIVVYHASGAAFDAGRHGVSVIFTGPQSSGAAKSFVMKYFLRDWLKIATGDLDADEHDPRGHHEAGPRRNAKNQISSIDMRDQFIKAIEAAPDIAALEAWLEVHDEETGKLFPEDRAAVLAVFKKCRKGLKEAAQDAEPKSPAVVDNGDPKRAPF